MARSQSFSWSKTTAALERAFRKLPISSVLDADTITYETMMPALVRGLAHMANRSTEKADRRKIKRKLKTLKQQAQSIKSDHTALVKLPMEWRHAILMIASDDLKPELPLGTPGRPKQSLEPEIARITAQHYHGLTGRLPDDGIPLGGGLASGPFVDLLTEVYTILGFRNVPQSHAQKACQDLKKDLEQSCQKSTGFLFEQSPTSIG